MNNTYTSLIILIRSVILVSFATANQFVYSTNLDLPKLKDTAEPRNVIFILSDDHRYDAIGAFNHPFLKTPHLDSIIHNGVNFENAFVTTSLCSPSRASILTGQYTHKHSVVDNNNAVKPGTIFFPQYLQKAGYETALIGKWHMGANSSDPRPGFDHWVSFKGQGSYFPRKNKLNVNGKLVPQKKYLTDELTDYALEWLNERSNEKPFMLYLSHKAVHSGHDPAPRHLMQYENAPFSHPSTFENSEENYKGKPRWVQDRRNSWHGTDFPYHRMDWDVEAIYKRYCEAILAVDEGIGKIFKLLKEKDFFNNTIIIYMGDNGFNFGEHGLLDKRDAYEPSIRVPLIMQCPDLFKPGTVVSQMVCNIDIGPTILAAAGLTTPTHMDGKNFLPLAQKKEIPWRTSFLYEYYWEWNFPQTPTIFALRGDQYKYIYTYGIWDIDELYDIQNDPEEKHNLINDPKHQVTLSNMRKELFATIQETQGDMIPLRPIKGRRKDSRYSGGRPAADFPQDKILDANEKDPWGPKKKKTVTKSKETK